MSTQRQRTVSRGGTKSRTSRPGVNTRRSTERVDIDPEVVYDDLLPDLAPGNNGFAWACCPFHDDHNPSFCVNVESGWYKCMSSSCGATGMNIVGFVGALLGYEYAEARHYLEEHYG